MLVLVQVTAYYETSKSSRQYGEQKKMRLQQDVFPVLASEKTLSDEIEQENLRKSFQIPFQFCPGI